MGLMNRFRLSLFTWAMLPVYVWQGVRLRQRIERLLPPDVPQSGKLGAKEPSFKLLVIGDSSVASVGMERLEQTFAYNIADFVHQRSGRAVKWRNAGKNSATSADLRDHVLPHIEERDFTHVILAVGINDMKNFHAISTFKKTFGTLLYALKARFPDAKIIWAPVPDMSRFPALPRQLARILAARAKLINHQGEQLCHERGVIYSEPVPVETEAGFARDGFHAGPEGYRIWGEHLVDHILADEAENLVKVSDQPPVGQSDLKSG